MVENLPANAGDVGLIPGWERYPGERNDNPLQCSYLENPIIQSSLADWATVHGVPKSQIQLSIHTIINYAEHFFFSCPVCQMYILFGQESIQSFAYL